MRRLRLILWGLVGVALLAGAAVLWFAQERRSEPQRLQVQASVGGPFTLTGADGRPFSSNSLAGKPHMIFFGFTHCPDVCPTTLARLTSLRAQLPGGAQAMPILFISVDPERDKPEDVGRYSGLFGSPVIGLTGSPAQIAEVKKQFAVFSQKVPAEGGGDYSVDHTATVFLMDRNGRFASTLSPGEGDAVSLDKLRRLLS